MSRVTPREVLILVTTAFVIYLWWQDRTNLAMELRFMEREVNKVERVVVRAREARGAKHALPGDSTN
jgi:hypothetical protein